ncbi:hypothetical protein [uncultured Megasphaera sp.]|uniref:hypothetical protein n=1 Tax=uncultured Megasphaera sp. TaxID=165188 RepID=UPI00266D3978|nr:hypothetical protein [uncultured Megasphaera sp.]
MNTLQLQTPLMINGKEVKELTYNTAEITVSQFCEAESYSFVAGAGKPKMAQHESDHGLHIYLGMMAVIAVNPHIDVTDLERLKGYDLVQLANIGRNFILTGAGGTSGDSAQNGSADLYETTPEPTAPAPAKSDDIL